MVSSSVLNEINALQEDEQVMVLSLIRSFVRRGNHRTAAQEQFDKICDKYKDRDLSPDEIEAMIQEARAQ